MDDIGNFYYIIQASPFFDMVQLVNNRDIPSVFWVLSFTNVVRVKVVGFGVPSSLIVFS